MIPDLSDMSGGLSNPVLFNFVAYCTWKTAGTFVTSPEGRTRLSRLAGQHLAEELVPEALAAARHRNPGALCLSAQPWQLQGAPRLQAVGQWGPVADLKPRRQQGSRSSSAVFLNMLQRRH